MNIIRIAIWDLRRLAKDWKAALWLLVLPLLFSFIFGKAFSGNGTNRIWVPVIDLDRSELSGMLIDQLKGEGYSIDVKGSESISQLKTNWHYGIVIPAGFCDSVLHGKSMDVTVVKGGGAADRVLEVEALLIRAVTRLTSGLASVDVINKPWNDNTRAALKSALEKPPLLSVTRGYDPSLRPPPGGFYQSLPGMLAMFVLQMILIYGGATLLSDRVNGQFARLSMTPVFASEVYFAKTLARIALGLLQAAILLFGGAFLFKVPLGDHPLYLAPVLVAYAIFAGCLSILGGVICKTEKQVIQLAIFFAILLAALGGCWWPIEVVPETFKTIASFTPTYWATHGIQRVMYFNKSWQVLTLECPILLAFAIGCLVPALFFASRLLRGKAQG